jgi:HAD superfamily hydrolase (TIGR01509 family)
MSPVRNIILDLGGVVLDINYNFTRDAFINLGFDDFEIIYSQLKQELIFDLFETGNISAHDFRDVIRNYAEKTFSDSEIDSAWNAMIIGLPQERVNFLAKLKTSRRLFLLSNTNEIHEKEFVRQITSAFGKNILPELFEKNYYSHHAGIRKPQLEIFKLILKENALAAEETLFIDDSPQHVEGAYRAGLNGILLDHNKTTLEKLITGIPGIGL